MIPSSSKVYVVLRRVLTQGQKSNPNAKPASVFGGTQGSFSNLTGSKYWPILINNPHWKATTKEFGPFRTQKKGSCRLLFNSPESCHVKPILIQEAKSWRSKWVQSGSLGRAIFEENPIPRFPPASVVVFGPLRRGPNNARQTAL